MTICLRNHETRSLLGGGDISLLPVEKEGEYLDVSGCSVCAQPSAVHHAASLLLRHDANPHFSIHHFSIGATIACCQIKYLYKHRFARQAESLLNF